MTEISTQKINKLLALYKAYKQAEKQYKELADEIKDTLGEGTVSSDKGTITVTKTVRNAFDIDLAERKLKTTLSHFTKRIVAYVMRITLNDN